METVEDGITSGVVEEIVDNRQEPKGKGYDYQLLIRWQGYPEVRDIW